jgi:putative membrane protein
MSQPGASAGRDQCGRESSIVRGRRSRKNVAIVLLISGLLLLPAWGQSADQGENGPAAERKTDLSRSDKAFLRQAAEGNQAAIELGQVAEQKGFSAAARNFARKLVAERSRAQQELLSVAHSLPMALPIKLSRHDRKTKQKLEKNSGEQLDRIFMANISSELERQYGNYEDTAMSTNNPEVKHYIEDLLSQVKHQDQVAKVIAPAVGASSSPQ